MKKKWVLGLLFLPLAGVLFMFQNFTSFVAPSNPCGEGGRPSPIGWQDFPKLMFTAEQLGRGVACSRPDLRDELLKSTSVLFAKNAALGQKSEVLQVGIDAEHFHILASGDGYTPKAPLAVLSPRTNPNQPGDARLVQRLAAASFFTSEVVATKYRALAKQILLHWADNTFKASDMARARIETGPAAETGLILGSNMTAFAAAYDLLAAAQVFVDVSERQRIESWFSRVMELIALSNDSWMRACKDNTPFSYDGLSCERSRGDNHITVATAAVYTLAVMTGNKQMQARAIRNETDYKWGYFDRLGYIIYNRGDRVASPDRFPSVHTGEIYDRWRGHYVERARGLHLHRSFSYPFLTLGFLTTQAMVAQRQGVDLMAPVQKENGKSIFLEKAFLFHRLFLKAYNPGEVMNSATPRTGMTTEIYYSSLQETHCVSAFAATITDKNCVVAITNKRLEPGFNDRNYTNAYYHNIMAGARFLAQTKKVSQLLDEVLTPEKMAFTENTFSPHIVPFEPALIIQ